ncbi:hypothetical protein PR048_029330 [Dryococelus australis]|uniref:Uncharacterized protein n=1 Tax=Dryococelus australis TaxID=614101 RepID=A0ABQ9GD39_9NEOP|nr:hypothetical protein PR048_029330 [Dryococelus australis]
MWYVVDIVKFHVLPFMVELAGTSFSCGFSGVLTMCPNFCDLPVHLVWCPPDICETSRHGLCHCYLKSSVATRDSDNLGAVTKSSRQEILSITSCNLSCQAGRTATVVPVGSRKKGYVPILPKKDLATLGNKLIVVPSSPSLSQETMNQQLVVIPPATDGNPITVYSYPLSEEPVHFSDSNPCTQSLPAICLDSPVAKDHEGREQLLGALNLLESGNKDSPNISESVVSPQLMKLVDISKNTLSPTTETVSAIENNLSVTGNSVSHDAPPPLEIYPRNTPTVASGLKQKGLNSRRLSLSTPRRKRSHIRTLDFNTPLKPTSIRKSNTSPKVSGKVLSQTSPKMSKSVRRMSLFKSPVNRVSTQSTLNESHVDRDTTENINADIVCPIATRSPATPLSGSWDKVTGAGLIIPDSSPAENNKTQTKKSVDDERELTESGSTDKHKIAKKKLTGTWDSALRALLSASYSDPEPPSKNAQSRKESKRTKKVAAEEARRIESELCKCSIEYINSSSSERSTIDTEAIEDSENRIVPQISTENKESVKKQKRVRQTPVKENKSVPVENQNTSIKGLNRRVKSKHTSESNCEKSPLKDSTKRCLKTSNSPLKNNAKTPQKRTVKTPLKSSRKVPPKQSSFKSKAKSPLTGKASRLTKCKNAMQKQAKQKSKLKVLNKIVKVCIEKIDESNQALLENSVNKNDGLEKMGNDEDSNIIPIKPNVSEENPCTSDENINKSKDGNSKLSGSIDVVNAGICQINKAVVEKNKSYIRKQRKNPSPSKNIHKHIEKEKDGIALDCEKKMPGGVFPTTESTTSKVVQSPTNLKAAKRTLVRNQLMAGRKLDLSEECTDVNNDVTHSVPSCSQVALLDTPEKTDTGTDVSLMVPMTPRIVSPRIVEDTPITKLIKEHISTFDDTIMTPNFPCTPNIPVTPRSLETDLIKESSTGEYPSRSTDYSSCSSYYQPSDDPNHQQKSLEQVLIDECCRMEANKVADVCGKTKVLTQNMNTLPDGQSTDNHKPSINVTETTSEQSECSQKEVSKTLKQTESLHESITKECLQTKDQSEDAAKTKPSGEKVITIVQENENVGNSVLVENQFASQVQDNQICSQIVEQHDSVKQVKQINATYHVVEAFVKEQKDSIVEQTKASGTLAKIKTAAYTTEVINSTSLPDKVGLISQQKNDDSHHCLSAMENVAKLKQNRKDVMNFVIERENNDIDENTDDQNSKKSNIEDVIRPATDEKHISSDKDLQKAHTEDECIESVVTCHLPPEDSNLYFDRASEEITDSLQQSFLQSLDKTKDANSPDEECVNASDSSEDTKKLSLNNKETSESCARTSVFIFTGKGAKTYSKLNSSFRNFRTKDDEKSISTSDSDSSSSEESSSDDECTELINCTKCESSKTGKEISNTGSTRKLNTSTESSTLSSELFGNCSYDSDEVKPTDFEDSKEKKADVRSSKNTFQQDTFKENDSEKTNTKTTATLQIEGPVTKTVSDTPNAAFDPCLPDGKLWLELEEKRLRTLAKLKETPKAKRRRSATEVLSKNCKEKTAGSISKMAAKDGKPNEETEISAAAGTVTKTKKSQKSRKQGVNAIAERLRMQQQAVAHSGTKLDSSREELHSTHTPVLTSEIELQLARMYGELDTNSAVASVHNIGDKTKSKLSKKFSPVRTLEDILSNTSSCDKDVKSRKRRHSSAGGRGSKIKNAGRPAAKFPKLSLRDRSVTSNRKEKVLEEKSNIFSESDKPVSSDVPVTEINLSGNRKKGVLKKEIVSAGSAGELEHADSSLNLLGVRTSASNTSELAEMVLASRDDDTALQKSADTNNCTVRKDYSNSGVSSCQDATADGIHIAVDSLSKNTLNSESNYIGQDIKSHISEKDSSSSNTCKSAEKTTCEMQNLVSNELSLKLSNENIVSSVPNKIDKDNLLPKSKNAVSGKINSLGCTSNKKDNKSSSSNKKEIKENILEKGKQTVSKRINKSSKKKVCGKGEEFEENASAAHCREEKIFSRDSKQHDNMTESKSSWKNKISNLKVNSSVTAKNVVSCQMETKINMPQSSEHRKKQEVSPNPPSLIKGNSSVKHSDSKELSTENETNLELAHSVSKDTSEGLPGFTKNGGITENSINFITNELQAGDKLRVISSSHEQNLVIDKETCAVNSGRLLGESPATAEGIPATAEGIPATAEGIPATAEGIPATAEGIMLSEKNKSGTVLPAQDSTQVLSAHENLSSEHILETEVPIIKENFTSPSEKVIYIVYKNNGPHLECEPPSFEYSDCAVKLLVDDFEVTCNITPFFELLNLLPTDEDESHAKECSTSVDHHKNKKNEYEGTNKFCDQSLNPSGYSSHKVTDISFLRVPKKVNDQLSQNKDMISPLSSLYEGPKKEQVSHKDKHLELDRLGIHNDKDKCKEKRDFTRPRIHDYILSAERHRGKLEMRERSRYLTNSARNIFYRKTSERHVFQDSGSHHERNTKSSSKHFDESQEGRHRVKYIRYDSSSRSRSSDNPHFYANRRDSDSEDHDLRGRDCNRVKSAKEYTPEAFDDGVEKRSDSKYAGVEKRSDSKYGRSKGRDEHYSHKKSRSELLDERDRNHVKSTKLPSKVVDEPEGRSRSKYFRYSYWNRTSNNLYSYKKVRNKMYEKKERLKDSVKNTKPTTRNKGIKEEVSKISQSRLNSEIKEYGEPSLSNMYKDSLYGEKNVETSYFSKTSKLLSTSSSVRKENKSIRDKVLSSRHCSSSDISEQLCSGRSTKDSLENKVSDEDSEYLFNSDPEPEMRSFQLEKSPGEGVGIPRTGEGVLGCGRGRGRPLASPGFSPHAFPLLPKPAGLLQTDALRLCGLEDRRTVSSCGFAPPYIRKFSVCRLPEECGDG